MALSHSAVSAVCLLLCAFLASVDAGKMSNAPHVGSYITLQVEPRSERCFFEEINAGQTFVIDFEVIRGGLLDIEFKIKTPDLSVVFSRLAFFNHREDAQNEAEGHVSHTASMTGIHAFCFDNSMSRWTAKVVSFFVRDIQGSSTQLPPLSAPSDDLAKLEHLGPMVDSVVLISEQLDHVERLQHHMRVREAIHRETGESTNARVMWLSILEFVVLLLLAAFQLVYIRSWFSDSGDKRRRV